MIIHGTKCTSNLNEVIQSKVNETACQIRRFNRYAVQGNGSLVNGIKTQQLQNEGIYAIQKHLQNLHRASFATN